MFSASVAVLGEPPLWRAWSHDSVIRAPGRRCSWVRFAPPRTPGLEPPKNGSICLRNESDLLCDEVRKRGYWPECADLPGLYARASADLAADLRRSGRGVRAQRAAASGPPLFVDAGANVGACTLHMLLSTEAKVLAFEPSAPNLFYASSSLLRMREQMRPPGDQAAAPPPLGAAAAAAWDDPADRLRLFPIALGEANASGLLYSAIGNAGHSVVGNPPAYFAPLGHEAAVPILVRRLDDVLYPAATRALAPPPTVALLKLDVEGFECKFLQGAALLLRERAIRVLKTEVFDHGLRQQGCSGVALQTMLAEHGFRLFLKDPTVWPYPYQAPIPPSALVPQTDPHIPYNLYCVQTQPFPRPEWSRRRRVRGR